MTEQQIRYAAVREQPPTATENKTARDAAEVLQRLEDLQVEIAALKAEIESAAGVAVEVPADAD